MATSPFHMKTPKRFYTKASRARRILRAVTRVPKLSAKAVVALADPEPDNDDASTAVPPSPTASASSSRCSPARDVSSSEVAEAPRPPPIGKRPVLLLPSVFEGRAPVLLFSYTEACLARQRCMDRATSSDVLAPKTFFSYGKTASEFNAITNSMKQAGLKRADADEDKWTVLWARHPSGETLSRMSPMQKTNHFPGSWHLGDKGLLWNCIAGMQERFGDAFSITPMGYVLPQAAGALAAARAAEPDALWIWKPCAGSCGRGIRVFGSRDESAEQRKLMRKAAIVQRYVPSPLLVNGFKFDMRIYVAVVSYEPLKVFINTDGLVRLATQKYSEDPATLTERTMHLTNYSLNKKSPLFVQNKDGASEDAASANKWSLHDLRANFEQRGLDYDRMFDGIKDVVIKTLLAVEPKVRAEWSTALGDAQAGWQACGAAGARGASSCFELYGFDILVDEALKSWLLEVNIYPSMSSGSPLDKRIKTKLIADTLTLVGVKASPALRGCRKRPHPESSDDEDAEDRDEEDLIVDDSAAPAAASAAAGVRAAAAPPTPLRPAVAAASARATSSASSAGSLAERAARLARCADPLDAVRLFDDAAWDLVLDAVDEDYRRGGFERIYPTASSAQYVPFMEEESYANVVLRRWYESGGASSFWGPEAKHSHILPASVPQQQCFRAT
eukprot:TRINITY_DN12656_c0_g3_i2.p1 TRINITY_DN12656_c0_g3~~TRINITY_DN12656_c0_g3_i2.p1  ORF type:complete len:674 (+),score=180.96 TRINITY_DN12656_c0_g3_i2:109-2130(+)